MPRGEKKKKQHFSTRCLDNSYRCSLRNCTPTYTSSGRVARSWPPLRLGCSCSSETLCPDRRPWADTVHVDSIGSASIRPTASSASPRRRQRRSASAAAGLPISGKGRTYGTASSTVVRARVLRGGGRRGGAPLGGAPEQERPASGSGGSLSAARAAQGDEPRFMSRSLGTISAICRRTRGHDRRSARLISGRGTGRQAAHRSDKARVLRVIRRAGC